MQRKEYLMDLQLINVIFGVAWPWSIVVIIGLFLAYFLARKSRWLTHKERCLQPKPPAQPISQPPAPTVTPSQPQAGTPISPAQSLLDWIDKEIDITERYHNHKEIMAWTATAFFLPAVVLFCYTAGPLVASSLMRMVIAAVAALLGIVAAVFVNMQFEMRWKASDIIDALMRCRAQLTLDPGIIQTLPTHLRNISPEGKPIWPQFIEEEIEHCTDKRPLTLFLKALPNLLIFHWTKIDARLRTEVASYLALLLATFAAIATLWIRKSPV